MAQIDTKISSIFIHQSQILCVGDDRRLWLMGGNSMRILGIGEEPENKSKDEFKSSPVRTRKVDRGKVPENKSKNGSDFDECNKSTSTYIPSPIPLNIVLGEDEQIKRFYTGKSLLIIFTTKGNLYTSGTSLNKNNFKAIKADYESNSDMDIDLEIETQRPQRPQRPSRIRFLPRRSLFADSDENESIAEISSRRSPPNEVDESCRIDEDEDADTLSIEENENFANIETSETSEEEDEEDEEDEDEEDEQEIIFKELMDEEFDNFQDDIKTGKIHPSSSLGARLEYIDKMREMHSMQKIYERNIKSCEKRELARISRASAKSKQVHVRKSPEISIKPISKSGEKSAFKEINSVNSINLSLAQLKKSHKISMENISLIDTYINRLDSMMRQIELVDIYSFCEELEMFKAICESKFNDFPDEYFLLFEPISMAKFESYVNVDSYVVDMEEIKSEQFNHKYLVDKIDKLQNNILSLSHKSGLLLLDRDVEFITTVRDHIFYKKYSSQKIYLFTHEKVEHSISLFPTNNNLSYEIILPFGFDSVKFENDFVHVKNKFFNYVFTVFDNGLFWIHFEGEKISSNDIFRNKELNKIYVKSDNLIKSISFETNSLEKFINVPAIKSILTPHLLSVDLSTDKKHILIHKFIDSFHSSLVISLTRKNLQIASGIIDISVSNGISPIIFFSNKNYPTVNIIEYCLFFNVCECNYYYILSNGRGIIYYDNNYLSMYHLSSKEFPNETAINMNLVLVEKINIQAKDSAANYYIYMFDDLPSPISDISFTSTTILIKSDEKYFVKKIYGASKFTELILDPFSSIHGPAKVKTNLVKYSVNNTRNNQTVYISTDSSKLDRLLTIAEISSKNIELSIKSTKNGRVISYGDGQRRQFFNSACEEFLQRFLVKNNYLTSFDSRIKSYTNNDLFFLGSMFHMIIITTKSPLCIRLPLILLEKIINRNLTTQEFEFFAQMENPEAYNNLLKVRRSTSNLEEITGYSTYTECLLSLCSYPMDPDPIMENICVQIAKGFKFYLSIANLIKMNIPTLDYYISGPYVIDRVMLMKKITINQINGKQNNSKQKNRPANLSFDSIRKCISELPEDKLIILLKNWTGSSVIESGSNLSLDIVECLHGRVGKNSGECDFSFRTCSSTLLISKKRIQDIPTLFDLLTVPMLTMED